MQITICTVTANVCDDTAKLAAPSLNCKISVWAREVVSKLDTAEETPN